MTLAIHKTHQRALKALEAFEAIAALRNGRAGGAGSVGYVACWRWWGGAGVGGVKALNTQEAFGGTGDARSKGKQLTNMELRELKPSVVKTRGEEGQAQWLPARQ